MWCPSFVYSKAAFDGTCNLDQNGSTETSGIEKNEKEIPKNATQNILSDISRNLQVYETLAPVPNQVPHEGGVCHPATYMDVEVSPTSLISLGLFPTGPYKICPEFQSLSTNLLLDSPPWRSHLYILLEPRELPSTFHQLLSFQLAIHSSFLECLNMIIHTELHGSVGISVYFSNTRLCLPRLRYQGHCDKDTPSFPFKR
jgi:hypothetical protein